MGLFEAFEQVQKGQTYAKSSEQDRTKPLSENYASFSVVMAFLAFLKGFEKGHLTGGIIEVFE